MYLFYFAILLTILSNIFYHLCQKSISNDINPILSLMVTYITAIIVCLIILPLYNKEINFSHSIKELNWANFTLGIAIVGLELGFLLAYRAGWNISIAALVSNVAVAIFLIPIGICFFKEGLTIVNILGIIFSIVGLILIRWK